MTQLDADSGEIGACARGLSAVPPAPTCGAWAPPGRRSAWRRQRGAAAVEFALVAVFMALPLLLSLLEFGRLFYLTTTLQEVTRRAAREQVVRWIDDGAAVRRRALLSGGEVGALPGAPEIGAAQVQIDFFGNYADALAGEHAVRPASASENAVNCLRASGPCIRFVRVHVADAQGRLIRYTPASGWLGESLALTLPASTVILPAEALGIE